jgi:cell wall-associated NlpC family hydrolase
VQAAVDEARAQIGKPYGSGGNGPDSFDCSGLTVHAFKAAGIKLPRTSFDQYGEGTEVPREQIQPGDLVFFDSNGSGASHVGVATSPTTMISATSGGVKENDFSEGYWNEHYVGARRVG